MFVLLMMKYDIFTYSLIKRKILNPEEFLALNQPRQASIGRECWSQGCLPCCRFARAVLSARRALLLAVLLLQLLPLGTPLCTSALPIQRLAPNSNINTSTTINTPLAPVPAPVVARAVLACCLFPSSTRRANKQKPILALDSSRMKLGGNWQQATQPGDTTWSVLPKCATATTTYTNISTTTHPHALALCATLSVLACCLFPSSTRRANKQKPILSLIYKALLSENCENER
jgi:hypothetical protein